MKKKNLTVMICVIGLAFLCTGFSVAKEFPGNETDVHFASLKELEAPDGIEITATETTMTVKIRFQGVTGVGSDNVKDGLAAVQGKTIVVHSDYLNGIQGKEDDIIAIEKVDNNGHIMFTRNNLSKKLNGQAVMERYWYTLASADLYAYNAKSQYDYPDDKDQIATQFIIKGSEVYTVPIDFKKIVPERAGVLPSELYGRIKAANLKINTKY